MGGRNAGGKSNIMIQAWQKYLLNPRKKYRQVFTTDGTGVFDAGRYFFTLVGGGASGIGGFNGIQPASSAGAAQGGVGGTLRVLVNIPMQTTLSLHIGKGAAAGTFYNSGTHTGLSGGDTYITGLPGVTMQAGGGQAPSVTIANGVISPVPGLQGVNNYSGVIRVIADNAQKIISSNMTGQFRAGPRPAERVYNTNFPEDTSKGSAGGNGWNGPRAFLAIPGQDGLIIIESE